MSQVAPMVNGVDEDDQMDEMVLKKPMIFQLSLLKISKKIFN